MVAPGVACLGASRVRRGHDPALGIDAAGDRRRLRPPVGPGRDHDGVVPGPDEVEQFISRDCGVDRDLGAHATTVATVITLTRSTSPYDDGRYVRAANVGTRRSRRGLRSLLPGEGH